MCLSFWNSSAALAHVVNIIDYGGPTVELVIAVVGMRLLWKQADARSQARGEKCIVVLAILAALLWLADTKINHRLLELDENSHGDEMRVVTNKLTQAETRLNAVSNLLVEAKATAQVASNVVNNANIAVIENLSRHLKYDQKVHLLSVIDPLPKGKITFFIDRTVPDADGLFNDLYGVFIYAKWQLGEVRRGMLSPLGEGIFVRGNDNETVKSIADEFTASGLHGVAETNPEQGQGATLSNSWLWITIGSKPR